MSGEDVQSALHGCRQALADIRQSAQQARTPSRRMAYIEERATAALENRSWNAALVPIPRGNTIRHLVRQILNRTGEKARAEVIDWLQTGAVPEEP